MVVNKTSTDLWAVEYKGESDHWHVLLGIWFTSHEQAVKHLDDFLIRFKEAPLYDVSKVRIVNKKTDILTSYYKEIVL